jgi:signal transduction histidine kinase
MLERLCHRATEILTGDYGCTLLRRSQEEGYAVMVTTGCSPQQKEALLILQNSPGATAQLARRLATEEIVEITEAIAPQVFTGEFWPRCKPAKMVCVALRRSEEVIGMQLCGYRTPDLLAPYQLRIARGISQVASLALANAILLEELERANRLKSDFVATMSHELRTPLNIIMGYTDLLLTGQFGDLSSEQLEPLERIDTNAKELLNLISATLDVSRLEAGRMPVEIYEFQVANLIGELQREIELDRDRTHLTLMWRVAPNMPPISSDWIKLKVILKNLIGNAVKFTEHGRVVVDARSHAGGVEFSVSDTGIGIAPDALPVIFEMFRQVDGSARRRYGGVGLGLYIVHRLLGLLEGTITVESEQGRGTTFRVWVPSAKPHHV